MTYLPILKSYNQPQSKLPPMQPADTTCLEMTNLTDQHRTTHDTWERKVGKSGKPPLLQLAKCSLALGVVLLVSLAGLCLHIFSPAGNSHSDLFNVIVVGGRGQDNSSLLSLELLDIGRCPGGSSSEVVIPSLPRELPDLTVSYLTDSPAIQVCGGAVESSTCLTLSNRSSVWERSVRHASPPPPPLSSLQPVSHRHGAALLHLSDLWLLVGGRRSVTYSTVQYSTV